MAPREIEGALRASFDALKSEFGGIILGMGAIDVIRGDILDFTYNLPPNFLKYHGRIVNLMRKNPSVEFKGGKVRFGSYYLFETEDNSLFVVFNVASRFAFVVHVKLLLYNTYNPAGYAGTGVSRGLGLVVVRTGVNNNRPTEYGVR